MKKILERQVVFNLALSLLAWLARRPRLDSLTRWLTKKLAQLNLALNQPPTASDAASLAKVWQQLMPPDGRHHFPIKSTQDGTAFTEIHLHCPLRGTGRVDACHKLMNYDRQLIKAQGGQLIVLESQSNSGKSYCRLAIRPKGQSISDLTPAYSQKK